VYLLGLFPTHLVRFSPPNLPRSDPSPPLYRRFFISFFCLHSFIYLVPLSSILFSDSVADLPEFLFARRVGPRSTSLPRYVPFLFFFFPVLLMLVQTFISPFLFVPKPALYPFFSTSFMLESPRVHEPPFLPLSEVFLPNEGFNTP